MRVREAVLEIKMQNKLEHQVQIHPRALSPTRISEPDIMAARGQ